MTYTAATETELINHLISFIEYNDQAMHSVMQQHGMAALRDNPELMGTSIGMLRRAATLLRHFSKLPETRKTFLKNTARLLQFTMSQLMDSRVAAYVAELLFEIQGTLFEEPERAVKAEKEEEKPKEDGMFFKFINCPYLGTFPMFFSSQNSLLKSFWNHRNRIRLVWLKA